MKIAVLGNVTPDFFAMDFRKAGDEVYLAPGFDAWRQEVLDAASGLHAFAPEAVLLVMEGGAPAADVARLRERLPQAIIVVPDLARLAEETPNFWDERMRHLAAMPFSLAGIRAIEDEFRFLLHAAPKKVLAVDADNTLWRGIVSEDGAAAVRPFTDFQRGLLALRARGVLLALLSKNDPPGPEAPISQAFAREEVPLRLDDFAGVGVDWSPKAGNLLAICRRLNLGVESVVFVDDNPHERAQMRAHLPQVAVPPFPADLTRPGQFLRRLDAAFFGAVGATAEDRARAGMYQAEAARRTAAMQAATLDDYLDELKLTCRPARAVAADVPRLAQMAGKTNQFNATTIRRTEAEMAALVADPGARVWTFRMSDAFGEMGLVCYVVYNRETARITDFVMSCRAMGRTLEQFAFNHVRRELAAEGLKLAGIDFMPTAKNGPFRAFLNGLDLQHDAATHVRSS
ncbi:MAG: HAD-IIIC family phosphatase [Kiritimatiellia bacterium]